VAPAGAPAADAVKPVVLFHITATGLRAAVILPEPDSATVLAGEGGDEVDVALGVADADPPRRGQVTVWARPVAAASSVAMCFHCWSVRIGSSGSLTLATFGDTGHRPLIH
jgi:hypothetical protein